MDFEELHGKSGSGTNVGVDLTTLMTSQVAVSTVGGSDGGGGSGSGDMTVPRIASFQVYWDVQGKQFKVFKPKVVDPNGNEIAVTETTLSRGTYVCEVKKNATSGNYTATIKLSDGVVPGNDTVTIVKLFKIEDGKVEQYHVGAIILGSGQITGEEGQASGSQAVGVSGKIDAKGENGSGLVMKTYKTGENKTLSIDLAGRGSEDAFGIKEVKNKDGTVVAKILATKGFSLPQADESTIDVLTGIDSVEVDLSDEEPNITIKFTKKNITVMAVNDVTATADAVIPLEKCDVVEGSEYTKDHEFKNKLVGLLIPGHSTAGAEDDNPTVFETTPHSSET